MTKARGINFFNKDKTLGIIMLIVILFQPGGLWAMYQKAERWLGRKGRGGEDA